ncbi:MAG: DNA-directed RNA polymerase subunit alpha [bacterium]
MKEIEKPTIKILEETTMDDGKFHHGRYLIQPLIRGFGTTMGNSLRRVLLSSIPGAAPVYLKIDGVLHEFTTIDGVVEDITEIVINAKGLPVACNTDELVAVTIDVKGPGKVTAGDIQADDRVEVVDPAHHIATLSGSVQFKLEIGIKRGRGYVASEWHEQDAELPKDRGIILLDSNFSPITNIRFLVEPARVGQRTDFDSLTIEIDTDGSVSPADALSEASKILLRQFGFVVDFKEKIIEEEVKKVKEETEKNLNLKKRLDELDLSVRAYNCLKNASISTVEELVEKSESHLRGLRNFGEKSLREIKEKIHSLGLSLQDELDDEAEEA